MARRVSAAERLKKLREIMGLNQRELADLLGVVHGAVGLWEAGKRKVPGPVIKLLEIYEGQLGLAATAGSAAEHPLDKLQSSWMMRGLKLTTTGTYIAGQLALLGIRQIAWGDQAIPEVQSKAYTAIARRLVDTLGGMKGLPQKLGQFISYMDFHLPEELRRELATLQRCSPPMSAPVIASQIVTEFRETPNQRFAEWTPEPFAAASLGQVHRAVLHTGEAVAVKVQYPGIDRVLAADVKNAAVIEQLGAFFLRGHAPGPLIQEIHERLVEECDYTVEARNQMFFYAAFADDPRVVIPRVFPDHSTQRVLTTEFIEGRNFSEFLRTASAAERNHAGEILWDLAMRSLFTLRRFNGDPHPGNYLFLNDGRIGWVDFGCVKPMDDLLFTQWRQFICGVIANDPAAVRAAIDALGMVPDPSRYDYDHFFALMRAWYEPWWSDRPYQFTRARHTALWRRMALDNPNAARTHFPRSTFYLNQVQWGLPALLAELGAESNWHARLKAYL